MQKSESMCDCVGCLTAHPIAPLAGRQEVGRQEVDRANALSTYYLYYPYYRRGLAAGPKCSVARRNDSIRDTCVGDRGSCYHVGRLLGCWIGDPCVLVYRVYRYAENGTAQNVIYDLGRCTMTTGRKKF